MTLNPLHTLAGPILLLAGPGTGKTEQLARRINYLVKERGVPPEEITVISFTRPAAANMRERISDKRKKEVYLARKDPPRLICTMHHLGYLIVRAHPAAAGYAEAPSHVVKKDLRPHDQGYFRGTGAGIWMSLNCAKMGVPWQAGGFTYY